MGYQVSSRAQLSVATSTHVRSTVSSGNIKRKDWLTIDLEAKLDGSLDGQDLCLVDHNVQRRVGQRGVDIELSVDRMIVVHRKVFNLSLLVVTVLLLSLINDEFRQEQSVGNVMVCQYLSQCLFSEGAEEVKLQSSRKQVERRVGRREQGGQTRSFELWFTGLAGISIVVIIDQILRVQTINRLSERREEIRELVRLVEDRSGGYKGVVDYVVDTV